jgi:predicted HicB family RNase H-like nuclease
MKTLNYKGYYGSIDISLEDGCLFGKLEFIDPLVTFEGQTVEELQAAFREAVDDYVATCKAEGIKPQKPYSGTFNVRVGQELHATAVRYARLQGMNLNEFVKQALEHKVQLSEADQVISATSSNLAEIGSALSNISVSWWQPHAEEDFALSASEFQREIPDNLVVLPAKRRSAVN